MRYCTHVARIKRQRIVFKVRTGSLGGLEVLGFLALALASDEPPLRGSVLVSNAICRLSGCVFRLVIFQTRTCPLRFASGRLSPDWERQLFHRPLDAIGKHH